MDRRIAAVQALEQEPRRRGGSSVALFGSLVHGTARSDSDVDVLIEVDPAARFDLAGVKNLLSTLFHKYGDDYRQPGKALAFRYHVLNFAADARG